MNNPSETPDSDRPAAKKSTEPRVPNPPHAPVVKLTPVPVYNCRVYLSGPSAAGVVTARCANLPELSVTAPSEREALQRIVTDFKAALVRYQSSSTPIPFLEPPSPAEPGERQRLIGVHL